MIAFFLKNIPNIHMYAKCHTKMIFKRPQDFGWSFVLFCTFLSKEISSTYKYEVSISFDCSKNHERHSEMRNIENVNI